MQDCTVLHVQHNNDIIIIVKFCPEPSSSVKSDTAIMMSFYVL